MPDAGRLPPHMAAAARRAAVMFTHWRRPGSGTEGEMAILAEMESAPEEWTELVCALLKVGCSMARAAKTGQEDEYLAHVIREASLDEVASGG